MREGVTVCVSFVRILLRDFTRFDFRVAILCGFRLRIVCVNIEQAAFAFLRLGGSQFRI